MRPLFLMAAAMALGFGAIAQTPQRAMAAPDDRSTGPTVPDSADTRAQDQTTQVSPSVSNGMSRSEANDLGYGNWRASNGFNADPENPSGGAPGPGTITDSSRINR